MKHKKDHSGHHSHPKHHDGHMSKESHMSHRGHDQGNMSPTVEDYQRPASDFSQAQFGKTLEYIERQDKRQGEMAHDIKKQGYQGRYS